LTQAFVAVGSNIDPEKNVLEALRLLSGSCRVTGVSTVYRTEPDGRPSDPPYYNCVVRVETVLSPVEFKLSLRRIEDSLGRVRTPDRSENRTIDLDLIIFGSATFSSPALTIPDPDIQTRPYLLIPLRELAPGLVIPGKDRNVEDLAASMEALPMERLAGYTDLLKKVVLSDSA
jgi:2-amino-4-hydroxy-6-hydroxymethyldihydropteridine diphosphokinase